MANSDHLIVAKGDRVTRFTFDPKPIPCFTPKLLAGIAAGLVALRSSRDSDFLVVTSAAPGVFNLGGDLALFREKIDNGDVEGLRHYASACIECVWGGLSSPGGAVTVALVQGDALGGGLECALSCDVVIAERGARMAFPESLFGLFPGMGAYSIVARRAGWRVAEQMILSGNTYTAEHLHALGLVDELADPGEGEAALARWLGKARARLNTLRAALHARRAVFALPRRELSDIASHWIDAAFRLDERNLRMMDRLIRAQQRRTTTGGPQCAS